MSILLLINRNKHLLFTTFVYIPQDIYVCLYGKLGSFRREYAQHIAAGEVPCEGRSTATVPISPSSNSSIIVFRFQSEIGDGGFTGKSDLSRLWAQ